MRRWPANAPSVPRKSRSSPTRAQPSRKTQRWASPYSAPPPRCSANAARRTATRLPRLNASNPKRSRQRQTTRPRQTNRQHESPQKPGSLTDLELEVHADGPDRDGAAIVVVGGVVDPLGIEGCVDTLVNFDAV